jgi:hypothetical protein
VDGDAAFGFAGRDHRFMHVLSVHALTTVLGQ